MTEPKKADIPTELYLTVDQVAERWQLSKKTVRRRIVSGALPAHRFGRQIRIHFPDLLAYERACRIV